MELLFDRYRHDVETYNRQVKRIREQKKDRLEKLKDANNTEDSNYLVTAGRVLELPKNVRSLWEGRQPTEKRDLLARLVCNPRLDGRTVRYDLRKPFDVLAKMLGVDGWRPQRDSNSC